MFETYAQTHTNNSKRSHANVWATFLFDWYTPITFQDIVDCALINASHSWWMWPQTSLLIRWWTWKHARVALHICVQFSHRLNACAICKTIPEYRFTSSSKYISHKSCKYINSVCEILHIEIIAHTNTHTHSYKQNIIQDIKNVYYILWWNVHTLGVFVCRYCDWCAIEKRINRCITNMKTHRVSIFNLFIFRFDTLLE